MKTWHIHIEGQVQGVGFRPFVYVLAKEFELKGWVNNSIDGVHIEINASEKTANNRKAILGKTIHLLLVPIVVHGILLFKHCLMTEKGQR